LVPCPGVTPATVSVVVEWENILLAEAERCRRMLRQLVHEVRSAVESGAAASPVELLLCFDEDEVDGKTVAADVAGEVDGESILLRYSLVPVGGAEYYTLKNAGAREASGDVVVFIDSDVIPETGWLENLLRPLEDEAVGVVAGNSYLDPAGIYGKTFALAWFFPLRAVETQVQPARKFFANNVAFRRTVFERFPFPVLEDFSRGSCWRLAHTLLDNGVQIVRTTGAQVEHPAPNGLRHFVARGLAQGRDRLFEERVFGSRRTRSLLGTATRLRRDLRRATRSIAKNHKHVGLSTPAVPAALGISTSYYLLCTLGELGTMVSPRFMARHFRI
jgi:hypothetical protein